MWPIPLQDYIKQPKEVQPEHSLAVQPEHSLAVQPEHSLVDTLKSLSNVSYWPHSDEDEVGQRFLFLFSYFCTFLKITSYKLSRAIGWGIIMGFHLSLLFFYTFVTCYFAVSWRASTIMMNWWRRWGGMMMEWWKRGWGGTSLITSPQLLMRSSMTLIRYFQSSWIIASCKSAPMKLTYAKL